MRPQTCLAATILALLMALPALSSARDFQVVITTEEIRIIREYYAQQPQSQQRGRNGLPPGIAKNLARGKPLPPGIAKQHLPDALQSKLPPAPTGYERLVLDGRVLLVEIATQVIHDILSDAVLR
jgi:hypothetical protein